jgi:uncharacterized protein (TIGR00255 family)
MNIFKLFDSLGAFMTYSMTGFARFMQQTAFARITYEVRSVNHRFMEMSFRLPEALQPFEGLLRDKMRQMFERGKFEINIKLNWHTDNAHELPLDHQMLNQVIQCCNQIAKQMPNAALVSPLELLRWPGVLSLEEFDKAALWREMDYGFTQTLVILQGIREKEGQAIKAFLEERLQKILAICDALELRLPELVQAQQDRLLKRFTELQQTVDAERLAQEMVFFAQRTDVAEELSRLTTHVKADVKAVLQLLQDKGNHGRRLDFLMQELNREANTLGAKSFAADQTQQAVELKVLIEQMREQIQNLE